MSDRRLTPSMPMLLAFEAAARHQNFTQAGVELSLTQSAVSRHILGLEELLEVELFRRSGRHVTLTEVGCIYARDIAPALARIRGASSRITAYRIESRTLHLAVLPTFASRWLLPRLAEFYGRHPDIVLHLHTRIGEYDLADSGLDAAINVGVAPWPGLVCHRLEDEHMVVVASPALLARQPIREPADVAGHLLLHVAVRAEAWSEWFTLHRLPARAMRRGPQFEFTAHLIQSAVAGIGIGLVSRCLVEDELRDGTLVVPLAQGLPDSRGYYLLYPPERANFPALEALRDWLLPTGVN
ncbi:MAG: LysR family transcriptional regulator [Rhodoplanes sp.]|uniref:LysR substrate-binding domain-containing protein n=1 Tax=Rhodoplanes sp. TaxID=1968906 RepID=UPI00179590F7|nr:LysR substrate-binding domain-containing protein [Rhodoplanes sp.]NVO14417.1 LysR family transcriptional regulator [Rhodoplanes sp.]